MALAYSSDGAWVLDQNNQRVVGPGGKALPIPLLAAQDLVATEDRLYVLDRLADRSVWVVRKDGQVQAHVGLPSSIVPGSISALMVREGAIWVEQQHEVSVQVSDDFGRPLAKPVSLPGRPIGAGERLLRTRLVEAGTGRVAVSVLTRSPLSLLFSKELLFGAPILYVLDADADGEGTIYVAALVQHQADANEARVFCISRDGLDLRYQALLSYPMPEEIFRRFSVLPEGGFAYAYADELGYHVVRRTCFDGEKIDRQTNTP